MVFARFKKVDRSALFICFFFYYYSGYLMHEH